MLVRLRDKGDINLVPFPSSLPFPSPASSKVKDLDDRRRGCEAVQLEILKRDLPEERARFVQWVTWLKLDTPVTGEGFRISRISTSLDRYIPEMKLKFDEDRLRELDEGADQVVPDSTKLSSEPYIVGMCEEKIRKYDTNKVCLNELDPHSSFIVATVLMPTSLFYSIYVTLTLHLVEGILTGSPTRDPPVTSEATSTRSQQRATKDEANFYGTRSEVDKEHCAVGCDAEGRVNYIVRDLTNSTYGFFLDVSMDAHLTRRFKGVGTGFSIEAQNATERENVTDRVPSLKRHLMKEIGGIPPWEEEMLARMQGALNLAPDLHWRGPSHGCEDMQLEFLYRYVSKRRAQFVQWVTWVNLDTPAPGQPLQITRLSTTLDRYIP
ncbi:hypothetical protein FOZ63_022708 [Perkinsus olseni]|uniref:Uncharacterized protein n=1 Tax=Perkinsus olseni TaxID=32597 RepID=A0A7J6TYH1_PEROL|nr:hypothetical protein FOZ63_022708 [Perkinsus olseni]